MADLKLANVIRDGEKFAMVALCVKTEKSLQSTCLGGKFWGLVSEHFQVPKYWKEWLGSIKSEEVESSNLLLVTKMHSESPDVIDQENKSIKHLAELFYVGLLLSSKFASAHKPVMLQGARVNGELGLRQIGDFELPQHSLIGRYPAVTGSDLNLAAHRAEKIREFEQREIKDGKWRLFRIMHLYQEARALPDILDRLHQYARCIEGLIVPCPGKTKRQFKSRTELFIGSHQDLMGEIYDMRSAAEHLHENKYLETFSRNDRLNLVKKEAVAEYIARTCVVRIIETPALWPYFANTRSLNDFWKLDSSQRQALWGTLIDPHEPLIHFDPAKLSDAMLGKGGPDY